LLVIIARNHYIYYYHNHNWSHRPDYTFILAKKYIKIKDSVLNPTIKQQIAIILSLNVSLKAYSAKGLQPKLEQLSGSLFVYSFYIFISKLFSY